MGAFEFENKSDLQTRSCGCGCSQERGEACIIAQKIFDQCRVQKCLTSDILGPARIAYNQGPNCGDMLCDGDIIIPPVNAASVTMHNPVLSRIDILRKCPNGFQKGCWDMELRYVFDYTLEFRRADGCPIGCIDGSSSYNLKITLFGSTESDVTTATDLYDCCGNSQGGPFVSVEGKAVGLAAELKYPGCSNNCGCGCNCGCNCGCGCDDNSGDASMGAPIAVNVTLGLFTIIKMFRTVNMVVESMGRCMPEECTVTSNSCDPCKGFDSMPFPLDLFSPSAEPKSCCGYGETIGSPNCSTKETECGCDSCDSCGSCNQNSCGSCSNNGSCGTNRMFRGCCR